MYNSRVRRNIEWRTIHAQESNEGRLWECEREKYPWLRGGEWLRGSGATSLDFCVRVLRRLLPRLAICVVFYDNYKYGHKALCLEQASPAFATLPLPPASRRVSHISQSLTRSCHFQTSQGHFFLRFFLLPSNVYFFFFTFSRNHSPILVLHIFFWKLKFTTGITHFTSVRPI